MYIIEICEKGNYNLLEDIVHIEYSPHNRRGSNLDGRENLLQRLKTWYNAFSEEIKILEMIEDKDTVICKLQTVTT